MNGVQGGDAPAGPAVGAEPGAGRKVDRESEGLYWGPVFGAIDRLEGREKMILTHAAEVAMAAARYRHPWLQRRALELLAEIADYMDHGDVSDRVRALFEVYGLAKEGSI